MTQEEARKLLPVIQAFAEGKKVQWTYKGQQQWSFTKCPKFSPDLEWRIKPEPFEAWVNVYPKSACSADCMHPTKEKADLSAGAERLRCIKVREVEGE